MTHILIPTLHPADYLCAISFHLCPLRPGGPSYSAKLDAYRTTWASGMHAGLGIPSSSTSSSDQRGRSSTVRVLPKHDAAHARTSRKLAS
ncbi:hypothetical protein A0H81_13896 [Grifola frondosa]|uniref:Uncharacterized protein n=1 Tax=Grifola frondosa TaxID=5627 RepID=A0A1C7LNB7_GRIFR|nr:hypothetical protein A0H81_13896 [Grifola frondosa]